MYTSIFYNLHPSPHLQVAPQYGSKERAKCTTWCMHVAKQATMGQKGFKKGHSQGFWDLRRAKKGPNWGQNGLMSLHPNWSDIIFGKTRF